MRVREFNAALTGNLRRAVVKYRTRWRPTTPTRNAVAVVLGYVAAAALYIAIGVLVPDVLLSVFVGIAYLLLVAWLIPAGVRRFL